MNATSIANAARAYASALDTLEEIRAYLKAAEEAKITDESFRDVSVTWMFGSSCVGYRIASKMISRMMIPQMRDLLRSCEHEAHVAVQQAAYQLEAAQHLGDRGQLRAGEVRVITSEEP